MPPWKEHLSKVQVVAHSGASKTALASGEKPGPAAAYGDSYRLFDTKSCVTKADFWLARFIPTFSNRSRKKRCIARVTPEIPHQF
jgi:hypothetical protein